MTGNFWPIGKYAMTKSMSNERATFGVGNLGNQSSSLFNAQAIWGGPVAKSSTLGNTAFWCFRLRKGPLTEEMFDQNWIQEVPDRTKVDRGPYGVHSTHQRLPGTWWCLTFFEWRKPYNWIKLAGFSCIQNRVVQRCLFAGDNKSFKSNCICTWEHATSFAECLALIFQPGFRYSWLEALNGTIHSWFSHSKPNFLGTFQLPCLIGLIPRGPEGILYWALQFHPHWGW